MGLSQRLSRAAFGVCMTVWAFIMVFLGLVIVAEWPQRMNLSPRWCVLWGSLLIAAGEFIFAIHASRMFPGASPRLSGAMEVIPVVAFIGVAVGVLFFWNP